MITLTAAVSARPNAPLGTWVDRSDLAGARATWRDAHGQAIEPWTGLIEFADRTFDMMDQNRNGMIDPKLEARRTQQYLFGSNRNGSIHPQLFVFPNTTIRQEVVSAAPLLAAIAGADSLVSREELRARVSSFDTNGNGYLDGPMHEPIPGTDLSEYQRFLAAMSPIVVNARQMTVEGKLEGVGTTIADRWTDQQSDKPVPPANSKPVLD